MTINDIMHARLLELMVKDSTEDLSDREALDLGTIIAAHPDSGEECIVCRAIDDLIAELDPKFKSFLELLDADDV